MLNKKGQEAPPGFSPLVKIFLVLALGIILLIILGKLGVFNTQLWNKTSGDLPFSTP